MKPGVVVVGLFAILAIHVTADQNDFTKSVEECNRKFGISDETVQTKRLQPRDAQCYMACLDHAMGILFPNNTINVEQIKVLYADQKKTNPDFYEKSIKAAEMCASRITANSDDCAGSAAVNNCMLDEKRKIGLKV